MQAMPLSLSFMSKIANIFRKKSKEPPASSKHWVYSDSAAPYVYPIAIVAQILKYIRNTIKRPAPATVSSSKATTEVTETDSPTLLSHRQCFLLSRLPLEFRQQIYHLVFARNIIHILRLSDYYSKWRGRELAHSICQEPEPALQDPCYCRHRCWGQGESRTSDWTIEDTWFRDDTEADCSQGRLLSLSRTCRQM